MIDKVSVLIAGDSHIEESLRSKRPDVKVVGVLHDLSLVEYVSAEVPVDELIIDPKISPRGESLDQWISRFTRAYPDISVAVAGDRPTSSVSEPLPKVITSQTIVVWSPKGGVGKTFVATNLACAAAIATKGKAVLMDLDVYSGDVSTYLDLLDGPTITEMLPEMANLRPDGLEKYTQRHGPSGLNVICGPRRLELSSLISVEHVRTLISLAERRWGLLYVDTPPDITSDIVGESIDAASALVLVVTQDICALRQSKVALDIFRKLGIAEQSIFAVLNRGTRDSPVPETKVEEYLEKELAVVIPDDRKTAERSVFQGKPAVLFAKSDISSAIWELVSKISPGLPVPEMDKRQLRQRRGLFW
ncbi:MAG: AAA family ATPase [Bacillota bacterium]|jgi:MinD-like ATPase involved in chromosome partitioning or flagellar assembly